MLQSLLWTLTTTPRDRILESIWNCPYQSYLAGLAVRADVPGLRDMEELSTCICRLLYIIRIVVFCEAAQEECFFEE
jgi:hypothetical protein